MTQTSSRFFDDQPGRGTRSESLWHVRKTWLRIQRHCGHESIGVAREWIERLTIRISQK